MKNYGKYLELDAQHLIDNLALHQAEGYGPMKEVFDSIEHYLMNYPMEIETMVELCSKWEELDEIHGFNKEKYAAFE